MIIDLIYSKIKILKLNMKELIERYLQDLKIANNLKVKTRKKVYVPLISSRKISEITGYTEIEVETFLNSSELVAYKFINSGMRIYEIL